MTNPKKYSNEKHTIFHGDALEVLAKEISSESIDLVFLDPPYNIGKQFSNFCDKWESEEDYISWAYQLLDECLRVLKPNGTLYVMSSTQAMPYFDLYLRHKITILSRIIWHYDSSGVQAKKYFGSLYEPILHCVKDKNNYIFNAKDIKIEAKTGARRKLIDRRKAIPTQYNTEKVPGNVWYFSRVRYRMAEYEAHPSQKPETLLDRIILASTNSDSLILDPCAGTFTCSAVAKRLGRRSIAIESQEEYIKIGMRRVLEWQEFQGETLLAPSKNLTHRAKRTASIEGLQGELFNADSTA